MNRTPASTRTSSYPRRDADGRIPTIADMFGGVAFSLILGVIIVVVIDAIFSGLGRGSFGSFSGWVGGVLAAWMFVEDFRAWRGEHGRISAALIGIVVALLAGIGLNIAISMLAPLFAGAISVTVAALLYAVVWFFGIRYFASR